MKVALAQINPIVGALEQNVNMIVRETNKARALDAELVLFPEMTITGYPPKDLLNKEDFVIENKRLLEKIIANSANVHIIVGFVDYDPNKRGRDGRIARYNAAALIGNQKLIGIQHKTLLPTYDVFDEQRYFSPATEHKLFDINNKKLGIEICEDLWDENYETKVTEILSRKGADLIVNISASPFFTGKRLIRERLLKEKSNKNQVPIFYVNLIGGQDDLVFDGASMAVSRNGNLIASGKQFQEDLILVDLENEQMVTLEPYDKISETYNALVLGLRDYCRKKRFRGVIIGLSGGIDSAVTAAIAVEALGRENVTGISMPSQYSSQHSKDDAKELAKNLGISLETIQIQDVFGAYQKEINKICEQVDKKFERWKDDTSEENLQARIRGNYLMFLSNRYKGFIVLSTGNKSELAVGYCTLYGDMCGGFAVLSDVLKTEVYRLANYIDKDRIIIPQNSIDKRPSAELKSGQFDQDTLPPYDILDGILKAYIEENKSKEEIITMGFDFDIVKWVIDRVEDAEFKRKQATLGIKITEKAFGAGRQIPIVNWYRG